MMADKRSRDCRVGVIELQLRIRYVKLSNEKYMNIQQSLPATPACYPIKRVVIRTQFVVQGISSLNWGEYSCGSISKQSVYGCGG